MTFISKNQGRGRRAGGESIRLGAVTGITEDGLIQVQFDGAAEASGKGYPALQTGADPAVGDRVACIRTRGSYIVLGKFGGVEV